MPDSPEANRHGCSCPGKANEGGKGIATDLGDGWVCTEFTIAENCGQHSNPAVWGWRK